MRAGISRLQAAGCRELFDGIDHSPVALVELGCHVLGDGLLSRLGAQALCQQTQRRQKDGVGDIAPQDRARDAAGVDGQQLGVLDGAGAVHPRKAAGLELTAPLRA